MNRERLNSVVEAARQFVAVVERDGLDARTFTEELADLELCMAELVAPTCVGCGTPILGKEGMRTGRNDQGWLYYHRTCCRDGKG
jgi:hypothetical protein